MSPTDIERFGKADPKIKHMIGVKGAHMLDTVVEDNRPRLHPTMSCERLHSYTENPVGIKIISGKKFKNRKRVTQAITARRE